MKRMALWVLCVACGGGANGTNQADQPTGGQERPAAEASQPVTEEAATESGEPELESPMAAVLDAHNRARAEHCAPPLEWSEELAGAAAAWGQELAGRGCPLAHSQGGLGENLFAATAGSRGPDHVVQAWLSERDAFDFERGGFSMETGHFTQVVWKGTERVGCATRECDGLDLWICNYDPPGNIRGGYRENVSPRGCAD
jgi:pathogenesis-related protein 1